MRVYVFGLVAASVLLAGCAPNRPASGRAEEVAGFTEMNGIVAELHRQVGRCWEPPRMNFREIPVIRLRVTLDADGSVRTVTILDLRGRTVTPFLMATANSARDAVRACSPYDLPRERYELWNDLVLAFETRPPG